MVEINVRFEIPMLYLPFNYTLNKKCLLHAMLQFDTNWTYSRKLAFAAMVKVK